MSNLRTVVQDADPLRHEAPRLDAERNRVRLTILQATPVGRSSSNRARLGLVAALAVVVMGVVALGYQVFGVAVEFLASGAERMRQATTTHVGRPMAILVDGGVVTAPVVRSPIGDSAVISGNYTQAEADRIAKGIAGR